MSASGGDFRSADFLNANTRGLDVSTLVLYKTQYIPVGENRYFDDSEIIVVPTDLPQSVCLTQNQLENMTGDALTRISSHLNRPSQWDSYEEFIKKKIQSSWRIKNPDAVSDLETLDQTRLKLSGPTRSGAEPMTWNKSKSFEILANISIVLEMISIYSDDIERNNHLTSKRPDLKFEILQFLRTQSEELSLLADGLPSEQESVSQYDLEPMKSWSRRFTDSAIPAWSNFLAPEILGPTSASAAIILGCGAIGSLISGVNPLGFGVGCLVGKLITGEIKGGAVADKISNHFEDDE